MLRPSRFGRLLVLGLLCGGFSLAMAAEADAGIFGRKNRVSRGHSSGQLSRGNGNGYALRGPSPLTFRVSSATYKRLTTFYPNVYRPR